MNKKDLLCKCGCGLDVNDNCKKMLTSVEVSFGKKLKVTSGARCWEDHCRIYKSLNKTPITGSRHLTSEAADIQIDGFTADQIMSEVKRLFGNMIYTYKINNRTVHIDVRNWK